MEVTNRYVVIKHLIDEAPVASDFEVKTLYLSIDPSQVSQMKTKCCSHQAPGILGRIIPGEVIHAYGVGRVIASGNPEFEKDDLVTGLLTRGDYARTKEGGLLKKLDTSMGFPLSYHVGILAFIGLTAYAGFFEVCKPKAGERVFVSTASGSVGNLVGLFAKLFGCYVVGCAGTQQKVDLLKGKLGFDDAFNYKNETDLKSTLKRYFPEGIDIYFDNVGAEMLEAAVENMNAFGRVAVCGVISEYTDKAKRAAPNMINVVYKRISIQGFLAGDYMSVYGDFLATTLEHLKSGKMHVLEDISRGVDSIPSAFIGLFRGDNIGKKIVQVGDE